MNKKISRLLFGLNLLMALNASAQSEGENYFNQSRIACHTIGNGKLVCPDLIDVNDKYQEDWLIKFIKSSQAFITSGDKKAMKVFKENDEIVMPDQPFDDNQIKKILLFIKSKQKDLI